LKRLRIAVTAIAVCGASLASAGALAGHSASASANQWQAKGISCGNNVRLCTEVEDDQTAFHWYVGHDEPSVLFYSNQAGSGNNMRYSMTLPKEPGGPFNDVKGYTGETTPAYWFGMAMCATESYPEQNNHNTGTDACTADSDTNIINPATSGSYANAPGAAYMELQFYPPGFAPQFTDDSCDATKWCAALTIDSLAEDPINGTTLNSTCVSEIGGSIEYVNFAYLTTTGTPNGPPNPKDFDFVQSGDPHAPGNNTLFMNQGDNLTVSLHDSSSGLVTTVYDSTTGQTGYMVASAANHFGQILYAPSGTSCTEQDYNFHPMYSTSGPSTRVLWAAHSYNVAFDDEIGHFDFCTALTGGVGPTHIGGNCADTAQEGPPGDQEPVSNDENNYPSTGGPTYDDYGCFPMSFNTNSSWIPPSSQPQNYCVYTNDPGFDGTSYHSQYYANGSTSRESSVRFSSPLTSPWSGYYDYSYPYAALETDLPRIETGNPQQSCSRASGDGCTHVPVSDDGTPASFYPFFSLLPQGTSGPTLNTSCEWGVGANMPHTISNPNVPPTPNQFGPLLYLNYWAYGGGGTLSGNHYNDFNSGAFSNPC
jgi:hypothetical protein